MAQNRTPGPAGQPVTVEARILETLPNGLFWVGLGAEGGGAQVQVHLNAGSSNLRLRVGDRVEVELMPFDNSRGRVIRKKA
jgi:translation initiation factor IF-1